MNPVTASPEDHALASRRYAVVALGGQLSVLVVGGVLVLSTWWSSAACLTNCEALYGQVYGNTTAYITGATSLFAVTAFATTLAGRFRRFWVLPMIGAALSAIAAVVLWRTNLEVLGV